MKKTIAMLMALILAQTSFCNPHHSGSTIAAGIIGLASGIIIGSTVQTPPPPPPVTYVQYPTYVAYPQQTVVVQPVQTTIVQPQPIIVRSFPPPPPPPPPRYYYRPLPPPPRFAPPPRHHFSAPPPPPSRRHPRR